MHLFCRELLQMADLTTICEQLRENSLTSLDLRYNKIGKEGASQIAEALRYNKTLTSLDLYNVSISIESVSKIAEALCYNISLAHLNLYNSDISYYFISKITTALRYNNSLITLSLWGREGASKIAESLQHNKDIQRGITEHMRVSWLLNNSRKPAGGMVEGFLKLSYQLRLAIQIETQLLEKRMNY